MKTLHRHTALQFNKVPGSLQGPTILFCICHVNLCFQNVITKQATSIEAVTEDCRVLVSHLVSTTPPPLKSLVSTARLDVQQITTNKSRKARRPVGTA